MGEPVEEGLVARDVAGMIEHMTCVMEAGGATIDPGEAHAMRDALEAYLALLRAQEPNH